MPSEGPAIPAFLLETTWRVKEHHDVFGRAEYVLKTGHELVLIPELEEARSPRG